jgi:hypothetical protein
VPRNSTITGEMRALFRLSSRIVTGSDARIRNPFTAARSTLELEQCLVAVEHLEPHALALLVSIGHVGSQSDRKALR